jgi:hypothetical protein
MPNAELDQAARETKAELELEGLKQSARIILAKDVYDALDKIADSGCHTAAVLQGPACRPGVDSNICPGCTAKHLMQQMRDKLARASWGHRSGTELIAAERERQYEKEGFDSEHDDRARDHGAGQISIAAACYAAGETKIYAKREKANAVVFEDPWPWAAKWDKRGKHSRVRELTKAGALAAAEIDRIHRALDRELMSGPARKAKGT